MNSHRFFSIFFFFEMIERIFIRFQTNIRFGTNVRSNEYSFTTFGQQYNFIIVGEIVNLHNDLFLSILCLRPHYTGQKS